MLVFTRSTGETQAGSRDPASFFAWAASLLADRATPQGTKKNPVSKAIHPCVPRRADPIAPPETPHPTIAS